MKVIEHTEKLTELIFTDLEIEMMKRFSEKQKISLQEVKYLMVNSSFWSIVAGMFPIKETEAPGEN